LDIISSGLFNEEIGLVRIVAGADLQSSGFCGFGAGADLLVRIWNPHPESSGFAILSK